MIHGEHCICKKCSGRNEFYVKSKCSQDFIAKLRVIGFSVFLSEVDRMVWTQENGKFSHGSSST